MLAEDWRKQTSFRGPGAHRAGACLRIGAERAVYIPTTPLGTLWSVPCTLVLMQEQFTYKARLEVWAAPMPDIMFEGRVCNLQAKWCFVTHAETRAPTQLSPSVQGHTISQLARTHLFALAWNTA